MNSNFLPIVAAMSLQVGLSFMSIIAKYALNHGLTPRILVAERLAIASAILIPLALTFERKTRPTMTTKIFVLIVIMSIFEPSLEQNLFYAGMEITSPTFTAGMFNLLPAITFVMACLFRLELVAIHSLPGKAKVVGTCVAVGGAMMMTFWKGQVIPLPWTNAVQAKNIRIREKDILKGGIMLVSSCLSWSFYIILQAKVLVLYPAKLSLSALICFLGTIVSTITALIWERNNPKAWEIHPNVTLLASVYGGCFSAITVYVVGWIASKKGPVFMSIFLPVNLIVTAIISSVIFSEEMLVGRICGAFVIIFGICFVLWAKIGEETSPPQPEPEPPKDTATRECVC